MRTLKVALAAAYAVVVGWAFTASADIPASAYVQTGLVAHWDGIDNVGTGKHDSEAMVWKDLAGKRDLAVRSGYGNFTGNALKCLYKGYAAGPAEACTDYKTLEIVLDRYATGDKTRSLPFWSGSSTRYFYFEPWSSINNAFNAGKSAPYNTRFVSPNETATCVVTYPDEGGVAAYTQAEPMSTSGTGSRCGSGDKLTLGGAYAYNESFYNGCIYAVRLYDRVLSAAEMATNSALDHVRFLHTDGYRYENGKPGCRFDLSVDGEGTIKIGNEPAPASFWPDFTSDVTLTAVPADGYTFVRWHGNTGTGDATQTTLTVPATRARSITAKFVKTGETAEYWVLDGTTIRNTANGCALTVNVLGRNLSLKGVSDLNDATVVNLRSGIFSSDLSTEYDLVAASADALRGKNTLTSVLLPDSLTSLDGTRVIAECKGLKYLRLSSRLRYIDRWMFNADTVLETVEPRIVPYSVVSIGEQCYSGITTLKGELIIDNPAFKTVPPTMFGTVAGITNIDFTGSSIATLNNTSLSGLGAVNFTLPKGFSNFAASSIIPNATRRLRFRGDPPEVTIAVPFTKYATSLCCYAPKWNAAWEKYLAEQTACTVAPMTAAKCVSFASSHPGESIPTTMLTSANGFAFPTEVPVPVKWWYPDEPPYYTTLVQSDVLGYDGQAATVSDADATLFDGTTYTYSPAQASLGWLAAEGAVAEIAIPSAAKKTRAIKYTGYRLHQLCVGDTPNGRAPTAWTLYGQPLDSDEFVELDSVVMTDATPHWAYFDWPEYSETAPDAADCMLEFALAAEKQGCYRAFRFVPTCSYNKDAVAADETPYGLMELEMIGHLTTPDPEIGAFAAVQAHWQQLDFTGTVSGLGENPSEGVKAQKAWAWVEVSSDEDFTEIAASSEVAEVTAGVAAGYSVVGLAGDTAYFARFVVSNDLDAVSTRTVEAATLSDPWVCTKPVCTFDGEGSVSVAFAINDYYAGGTATVKLYRLTNPGDESPLLVCTREVSGAGTLSFDTFADPSDYDTAMVKVVVEAGTVSRSYTAGVRPFWMTDDATSPTMIVNTVDEDTFKVGCTAGTSNLTILAIVSIDGSTDIDFRLPFAAPSTNRFVLTSVGSVFSGNAKLTSMTLPDTVTALGANAFYQCTSLKSVVLPSTLLTLGDAAFYGCAELETVTPFLPEGLTSLGGSSFYGCAKLKSDLVIPAAITWLPTYPFYGCSSIGKLTFAGPIRELGNRAFNYCTSLTNVLPQYLPDSVRSVGDETLSGLKVPGTLHLGCPDGLSLGGGAFGSLTGIVEIDMTGCGRKSIGGSALFGGHSGITNVIFSASLESFTGPAVFSSVTPKHVTFLGAPPECTGVPFRTGDVYEFVIPRKGDAARAWEAYFASHPDWLSPMTAADRAAFRTAYPGERVPKQKLNLGGQTGFHYLQPAPSGFVLIVR